MIALNPNSNFIQEVQQLQSEISSLKTRNPLLRWLDTLYTRRQIIKRLIRIKKVNISLLNKLKKDVNFIPSEELHKGIKELLFLTKDAIKDASKTALANSRYKRISNEVINLAYEVEKTMRVRLYSNKPKKETSDFAKAVSSLSLRSAAKGI